MNSAILAIRGLPIDLENPLEILIREKPKKRGLDQNARYHAGPLRDIADQAYVDGRVYSSAVWHEFLKELYLPSELHMTDEDLAKRVVRPDDYRKYAPSPGGKFLLVGSTTELTKFGMYEYTEQVYAYGAGLGVMFTSNKKEGGFHG
jgi:hypothetical protein